MKKTKVVCTMGPNTNDKEVMRKLIQNGMDVARFNFHTVITKSRNSVWIF